MPPTVELSFLGSTHYLFLTSWISCPNLPCLILLVVPLQIFQGSLLLLMLWQHSIVGLFWLMAIQCQASAEDLKQGHFGEVSCCLVLGWSLFFCSCLFFILWFSAVALSATANAPTWRCASQCLPWCHQGIQWLLVAVRVKCHGGRVTWQCAHQKLCP